MKIETKFDIGQEVWFIFDRVLWGERLLSVEKSKIYGIDITNDIKYYFETLPYDYKEEHIFLTKEEAEIKLQELKKGMK